jgi:hypothetical protein
MRQHIEVGYKLRHKINIQINQGLAMTVSDTEGEKALCDHCEVAD